MTKSTALESGTDLRIGQYHFIAKLARGGMGNVYLATSQGPGGFTKLVAVKELKPELCDDPTYVTMFLEEARLAARLVHPNVVQTNEVRSAGGRHYMVMEYLDGRSLYHIGKWFGARLPLGAQLRIIADALLGLHYIHDLRGFDGQALGIVHRDVSPLNVLVTFNGQAKLLDFGIAKVVDSSLETKTGVLKGRVAYMAPEQARGAKLDRRADIYSAGVMLWEAAAGRRLWPKTSDVGILTRVLHERAPSLRSVQPQAPADLDAICTRAMAHDPDDRYVTVADLLRDLETHLARRNDTLSMREIGTLVGHAFTDERKKMNAVIEELLTRLRAAPLPGAIATSESQLDRTHLDANLPLAGPIGMASPLLTPSNSFGPHSVSLVGSAPTSTAPVGLAPATPQGRRPSSTKRAVILGSGAGVVLISALLVGPALHKGKWPMHGAAATTMIAPTREVPSNAAPPSAAPAEDLPRKAHVVVTASPKAARIYIDEALVSNPYIADQVGDTTPHRLRVEAPGYQSKVRSVTFGEDMNIEVALDAVRQAPTYTPAMRRPVAAQPQTPVPNCQPPYIVDLATGTKHWRLDCL